MWKTREPQFAKLQKKYGTDIQRWFLNRLPQAATATAAAGAAAADVASQGDAGQDTPAAVPAATSAVSQGQQAASKPAKAQNHSKKKRKKVQG